LADRQTIPCRRGIIPAMIRLLLAALLLAGGYPAPRGATFHVDPERGSGEGDGSEARPWKTLAEVISSGKVRAKDARGGEVNPEGPVKGGDTILLRSGYHGEVDITGAFLDEVLTVAAEKGQVPKLGHLGCRDAAKWTFRGLEISPSLAPEFKRQSIAVLGSRGATASRDLVIEDCYLHTVEDASAWTKEEWSGLNKAGRSCSGIDLEVNSTGLVARNNFIMNVATGINIAGPGALVEGNVVRNFAIDGLRTMGDNQVLQYNVVKNNRAVDANHDDGIQAFLYNKGTGTLRGTVTRANIVINREDETQPFPGAMQGIGYFDGPLIDFVIERNVVLVDHWHGVSLYDGQNGRIEGNVVWSRWTAKSELRPWVMLGNTLGQARGNTVRNNFAFTFDLGKFAEKESDNKRVSEAIFQQRLEALEKEIDGKFGRYHPVSRFSRVRHEKAKGAGKK